MLCVFASSNDDPATVPSCANRSPAAVSRAFLSATRVPVHILGCKSCSRQSVVLLGALGVLWEWFLGPSGLDCSVCFSCSFTFLGLHWHNLLSWSG